MSIMKGASAMIFALLLQGCIHDEPKQLYRHDYVLKDPDTGKPMPYFPYQITTPDGKVFKGITDKDGVTVEAFSTEPGEFMLSMIPPFEL
ncbi:hypothetical protein ACU611_10665 [Klebsiella aerogenes]|uniref:hypothetical protein n=1 Tax=Klebsiella TaxID=570 RepID=UPI0004A05054|nr:hypothetical protein [Klebsiella aerogenes]EIV2481709.1 hypothetical protein [Klebsiella aerogenes]EIV5803556.1 hypothetical protein [Klebsiella aerogenes]EIX9082806.1 hypothetical protein [Klebsiella aerogenes]EJL5445226.1 hypothetical protein [Klebsiella aerogenes]EKY1833460.1 hypothetical protein [Klebsiella aerogenes]